MLVARSVRAAELRPPPVRSGAGRRQRCSARAIVIATGAQYNKPRIANLEKFEGQGVYYGATYMESQLARAKTSSWWAAEIPPGRRRCSCRRPRARFTCWCARKVSDTMSRYLIQRIDENPAIELHYHTEIVALEGEAYLERVTWRDNAPAK